LLKGRQTSRPRRKRNRLDEVLRHWQWQA